MESGDGINSGQLQFAGLITNTKCSDLLKQHGIKCVKMLKVDKLFKWS